MKAGLISAQFRNQKPEVRQKRVSGSFEAKWALAACLSHFLRRTGIRPPIGVEGHASVENALLQFSAHARA
jgi:hypothetical protein